MEGHCDENATIEHRKNTESLLRSEGQGALHHQCIDELSSHIRYAQQKVDEIKITANIDEKQSQQQSNSRSETPTSFVTVIEVKDSPITCSSPSLPTSASLPTSPASISVIPNSSIDDTYNGDDSIMKNEESCSMNTVQNIEVKRKIPPRLIFCDCLRKKELFSENQFNVY